MIITIMIFVASFLLFTSYTIVSLIFASKKRNALRTELHELVKNEIQNIDSQLSINPNAALQIAKSMDLKFQDYYEYSNESNTNILKLSVLTTAIGILLAVTNIIA